MIGRVFLGRYETVRLLGQGGMGAVYLARTAGGTEPVVIKVMHPSLASRPRFREKFEQEAALMMSFRHPNAVEFLEASSDDPNGPCIAMEYIPGITLDQLLVRNGRFSPPRLRRLLAQFCDVLQAAHTAGIIHRDLKPVNLMVIDPDTPSEKLKVMDFGLACLVEEGEGSPARLEAEKEYAVGTVGYMSPEQVSGDPTDHRADLYSLGVILYEMLTGRRPFVGTSTMEILMAQATEGPPTFASLGLADRIPRTVEHVVRTCLDPDPKERPDSAQEIGECYELALSQSYNRQPEAASPAESKDAAPAAVANPAPVVDAVVENLEAWMPEQIAVFKLRGFVEAMGGKIVENSPGLVKIRLKPDSGKSGRSGFMTWLRHGRGVLDLELRMAKKDPTQPNLLHIVVMIRPAGGGPIPNDAAWLKRCKSVHSSLKAYLMSK